MEQSNNNIQDNWKAPQQEILSLLIVYSIYGAREQFYFAEGNFFGLKAAKLEWVFYNVFFSVGQLHNIIIVIIIIDYYCSLVFSFLDKIKTGLYRGRRQGPDTSQF